MEEETKDLKVEFYTEELSTIGAAPLLFFMDIMGKQGEYVERAAAVKAIRLWNKTYQDNLPTVMPKEWYLKQVSTPVETAAIQLMERVTEFNL